MIQLFLSYEKGDDCDSVLINGRFTEDVLRTCGGSSAAVRGKAKEKSTNS